jgi:hypothetical protein
MADASDSILLDALDNSPRNLAKISGTIPLSRFFFGALESRYISAQTSYQGTRVQDAFQANATLSTGRALRDWEFSASCYNAFNDAKLDPAGPNLEEPEIRQDGRTYLFKLSRTVCPSSMPPSEPRPHGVHDAPTWREAFAPRGQECRLDSCKPVLLALGSLDGLTSRAIYERPGSG